jgi:23S rRNA (cytidine1920-2'-O)/16S rRNA (cytidine1409-2'-O)-methyltransferase
MSRRRTAGGQVRADVLLVERGAAPTRTKAQALILAGRVFSGPGRVDKPGQLLAADAPLRVTPGRAFVSRGGTKLQAALEAWDLPVRGADVLDVGASTGGFTQALLEAGARRVAALDVGRGQLDWELRRDERVIVMDGVNARHLRPSALPFRPTVVVIDVSFISLELILPAVADCLEPQGEILALVKPQFEVGRGQVGPGGIVRDAARHVEVLARLSRFARLHGWAVAGVMPSPIRGAEGNREFFMRLRLRGPGMVDEEIEAAIRRSVEREPEGGT